MCTHKRTVIGLTVAALLAACATPLMGPRELPQGLNLGRAVTADEIKAWDISIPPSGAGLPPGSGSVQQGAAVYRYPSDFQGMPPPNHVWLLSVPSGSVEIACFSMA